MDIVGDNGKMSAAVFSRVNDSIENHWLIQEDTVADNATDIVGDIVVDNVFLFECNIIVE